MQRRLAVLVLQWRRGVVAESWSEQVLQVRVQVLVGGVSTGQDSRAKRFFAARCYRLQVPSTLPLLHSLCSLALPPQHCEAHRTFL